MGSQGVDAKVISKGPRLKNSAARKLLGAAQCIHVLCDPKDTACFSKFSLCDEQSSQNWSEQNKADFSPKIKHSDGIALC